ncbi:MAG: type III pantothenate kinase [Paludibacter sp.]
MNLCIDQGNSSTKVGIFDNDILHELFVYEVFNTNEAWKLVSNFSIDNCIISSVINENRELLDVLKSNSSNFISLCHNTAIPIENRYETPETLGNDRLAAVVGAAYLKPNNDVLVIDAGTAITYDFIDANGVYWGGNIAAGINLRLQSLHEFTKKLPLVEITIESPLIGNNTKTALISGALHGIVFEMDGYITSLKTKYPQLSTFLTGGSTFYFDTKLKNAIFAEKNLVLIGLNRILQYNVQK